MIHLTQANDRLKRPGNNGTNIQCLRRCSGNSMHLNTYRQVPFALFSTFAEHFKKDMTTAKKNLEIPRDLKALLTSLIHSKKYGITSRELS